MTSQWQHTPEQKAFRDRVLQAHLELSQRTNGPPRQDLPRNQLIELPPDLGFDRGRRYPLRSEAATLVVRLLADARRDLAVAKAAGDSDALRTTGLFIYSAYRT